jgi:hypothetical protein
MVRSKRLKPNRMGTEKRTSRVENGMHSTVRDFDIIQLILYFICMVSNPIHPRDKGSRYDNRNMRIYLFIYYCYGVSCSIRSCL